MLKQENSLDITHACILFHYQLFLFLVMIYFMNTPVIYNACCSCSLAYGLSRILTTILIIPIKILCSKSVCDFYHKEINAINFILGLLRKKPINSKTILINIDQVPYFRIQVIQEKIIWQNYWNGICRMFIFNVVINIL